MFKQKNALIAIAVAMLVAACGGGGGDDPPANNNPPAQNPGGNNPPGNGNPVDTVPMTGFLTMTANQVAFNDSLIDLDAFKSTAPNGGGYGIVKGTNAPFSKFGIRVYPGFMGINQTKVVRVAIDATNTAGGAAAESFKLLIDQVEIAVGATPDAFTVTVPATAKAYVYVRTGTGATVNAVSTAALPADVVKLDQLNVTPPDTDSHLLNINVDAAIASAKGTSTDPVFTALPDFLGRFTFNATISNVELRRADGTTVEPAASIDVTGSGQQAVTGGGVQGFAWFNRNPD